jgi:hypothetical protein
MKTSRASRFRPLLVLSWAALILCGSAAHPEPGSDDIPKKLLSPDVVWGRQTNGLRAGITGCVERAQGSKPYFSTSNFVRLLVLTSDTNVVWVYLAPPGKRLTGCDLRDPKGRHVSPLPGKRLEGALPQTIKAKDWPPLRPRSKGHPGLQMGEHSLVLTRWSPRLLFDFKLEDVYPIQEPGNYVLTVRAAVYRVAPDDQSASRVDLPSVSQTIYLLPVPKD